MSISGVSAYRIRDFRLLTQVRFLLSLSTQIQAVVIGWQMYDLTHDPLFLGLIGLTEALPALSLALVAGHVVDRGDPLRIYRNVVRLSLLSAAVLVVASMDRVGFPPAQRIPFLYLAAVITGVARGFTQPSLFSLIPQIVPREALQVSSAWTAMAFQIGSVVGPALGGVLYGIRGVLLPYALECALLGMAILLVSRIEFRPGVDRRRPSETAVERIRIGLRFVFSHQLLLAALSLDMFGVFFGGATAILPVYAAEILKTGPEGLGVLRAAPAVGALAVSTFLIRFPIGRRAGPILLVSVVGFGLATIGFGLSRDFALSCAFLAATGAFDAVSMVVRGAVVQLSSPSDMRGRIAAVNSMFIGSSNEIGAFESGVAARFLGTVPSVVFGGTMTLLTVLGVAAVAPRLRKLDLREL